MSARGFWIDHFPGNFLWSNAALACKGMAPYGVVAMDEIDRIRREAENPAGRTAGLAGGMVRDGGAGRKKRGCGGGTGP